MGRVDEAPFGLIMEGVSSREPVTDMAARTRRPVRFLEPELTRPTPLEVDSGLDDSDSDGDSLPAQQTAP